MRRGGRPEEVESLADAMESLRGEYSAARSNRFRRTRLGISYQGSGADYHYRDENDYLRLLEFARDLDRNDLVAGALATRAVDNTVQTGFRVDAKTGSDELDLALWELWEEWSRDAEQCDAMGELTFGAMERLVFRESLVDGDIVALPLHDGRLQLVESHRVRTPSGTKKNVVNGVLLDNRRRRLEYWLTKDDIDPSQALRLVSDVIPYPVRDGDGNRILFHVYNPRRASQTRGVSAFAPIFDAVGMLDDTHFARLVQQQIVSCFAIFRQKELGWNALNPSGGTGEVSSETWPSALGTIRTLQGIAPGMEIEGRPGETLSGFSPNVPNPEFFQFDRLILTLIGMNLGIPLIIALMDASETNFSGWRGAFDQAKLGFVANQVGQIDRFESPAWRWKVRQWLAGSTALRKMAGVTGVNAFGHKWVAPRWPYIQPMEDAQADAFRMQTGLASPRRVHAERGQDWETIVEESIADNAYAIRAAKREAAEINKEFAEERVSWRELIALPVPEGVTVGTNPQPSEPGRTQRTQKGQEARADA